MPPLKNPFEVLGLTPEVAHRLEERDLFTLIKTVYRHLSKVYHPDMARARSNSRRLSHEPERAVELNLAFEALNMDKNKESFRRHRRLYAARANKGLRKKIQELSSEIRAREIGADELGDSFLRHLLSGADWLAAASGQNGRRWPLNARGLTLGLNDLAISYNIRALNWELGSNYKEIILDHEGRMFYRPVGRKKPFEVKYIHLLGSVDVEKLEIKPLLNQPPPRPDLCKNPAQDGYHGVDNDRYSVENTISLKKFKKHCLPLLEPAIQERAYLFSVQRPVFEQEENIYIEGVVVKAEQGIKKEA